MKTPTLVERAYAVRYMLRRWPTAHSLRYEGKCDVRTCRKPSMWSCVTDDDKPRGKGEITCGYFCTSCGFSNAGSRSIDDPELEDERR